MRNILLYTTSPQIAPLQCHAPALPCPPPIHLTHRRRNKVIMCYYSCTTYPHSKRSPNTHAYCTTACMFSPQRCTRYIYERVHKYVKSKLFITIVSNQNRAKPSAVSYRIFFRDDRAVSCRHAWVPPLHYYPIRGVEERCAAGGVKTVQEAANEKKDTKGLAIILKRIGASNYSHLRPSPEHIAAKGRGRGYKRGMRVLCSRHGTSDSYQYDTGPGT